MPEHVWPLMGQGEVKGVRFKQQKGGQVDLRFPKSFWFTHQPEAESPFGLSALKGAYSPWADKNLNGGALDVRRLFMHKDAYGGVDMTYPPGVTQIDSGDPVPNRDIAREITEQIKAGGVTTRPSEYDATSGKPLWELTRATVPSNPIHILQYPKDLDIEMLRGLEIPDDILVSENGGAWQGKQVPMQAFFTAADIALASVIRMLTTQILEPLVELNFGEVDFEIETKPLAEDMMEQMEGNEQQPQPVQPQPFPQQMSLEPTEAAQLMIGGGVVEASELVRMGRDYLDAKSTSTVDLDEEPEEIEIEVGQQMSLDFEEPEPMTPEEAATIVGLTAEELHQLKGLV